MCSLVVCPLWEVRPMTDNWAIPFNEMGVHFFAVGPAFAEWGGTHCGLVVNFAAGSTNEAQWVTHVNRMGHQFFFFGRLDPAAG